MNYEKFDPPAEAAEILTECPSLTIAQSVAELVDLACGGARSDRFEVAGKGRVVEATVARVRNGVATDFFRARRRGDLSRVFRSAAGWRGLPAPCRQTGRVQAQGGMGSTLERAGSRRGGVFAAWRVKCASPRVTTRGAPFAKRRITLARTSHRLTWPLGAGRGGHGFGSPDGHCPARAPRARRPSATDLIP